MRLHHAYGWLCAQRTPLSGSGSWRRATRARPPTPPSSAGASWGAGSRRSGGAWGAGSRTCAYIPLPLFFRTLHGALWRVIACLVYACNLWVPDFFLGTVCFCRTAVAAAGTPGARCAGAWRRATSGPAAPTKASRCDPAGRLRRQVTPLRPLLAGGRRCRFRLQTAPWALPWRPSLALRFSNASRAGAAARRARCPARGRGGGVWSLCACGMLTRHMPATAHCMRGSQPPLPCPPLGDAARPAPRQPRPPGPLAPQCGR